MEYVPSEGGGDGGGGDDGGGGEPTPTSMHVHDLDGISYMVSYRWRALATITVLDDTGNPVANALVEGSWSIGSRGSSGPCWTDSNGQCSTESGDIGTYRYSTTFTVTNVTHGTLAYAPGDNNEGSVTIIRP